jgi:hypothetical protein
LDIEEFYSCTVHQIQNQYNWGDKMKGVEMTELVGRFGEEINAFCALLFEIETKRSPQTSGR